MKLAAFLLSVFLPAAALAQGGPVTQSGQVTPGHVPAFVTSNVIGDGGSAVDGAITNLGLVGNGTPFCINDVDVSAASGYHQLCIGANALGGGLLSYNAFGGAAVLPFQFNINGTTYVFPGQGQGNVNGPASTTLGYIPTWAGTTGTLLSNGTGTGTIGGLIVTGGATVGSTLGVTGLLTTNGGLVATGGVTLAGGVGLAGGLDITSGGFAVTGGASTDTLAASGNATVGGTLGVTGATTVSNSQPILTNDGSGHLGAVALSFATHAALLAYQPTNVGSSMVTATTAGYTTAGDGGSATYRWSATSSATDASNTFYVTPTGWVGNGRWILDTSNGVSLMSLGLTCNGTSDVSAGMSNRFAIGATLYPAGLVYYIPSNATCYIGTASAVTVPVNSTLAGIGSPFQSNTGAASFNFSGALLVDPAATFKFNSTLRNLLIARYGLSVRPTTMEQFYAEQGAWNSDSSIGATCALQACQVKNVELIGFNIALVVNGAGEWDFDRVNVQGANGINISNVGAAGRSTHIIYGAFWGANLGGHFAVPTATVAGGSTGLTNGAQTFTMTASGNTCTTKPSFSGTVSGGTLSGALTSVDVGDCTVIGGPNPVTFTGAGGSVTLTIVICATRGCNNGTGIGVVYNKVVGGVLRDVQVSGGHIGVQITDSYEIMGGDFLLEPGMNNAARNIGDTSAIALDIEASATNTTAALSSIYLSSSFGTALYVNDSTGGLEGSVNLSAVQLATPNNFPNQQMAYFAAGSTGTISGLSVGGPGSVAGTSVVFAAGVDHWDIGQVSLVAGSGVTTPWYQIDPTSAPLVNIISLPTVVSLTSGATQTIGCNTTDYINDATAPTITLPAVCPLGQDIIVNDIGGQAGTHNITLSMPGGSTINGGSTYVISTNNGHVRVQYNGVAAAVN